MLELFSYTFFFKEELKKSMSLGFFQDYEKLEPRFGKVKNKNDFLYHLYCEDRICRITQKQQFLK